MTLSELADIGEFLGGLAVVVSLVYLALQIRQNSRQVLANTDSVQAGAVLESTRLNLNFHEMMATNPDLVEIWDIGLTNPAALSDQQKRRFVWVVSELFVQFDGLYSLTQRGVLPAENWEVSERNMGGFLLNPLVKSWYESRVTPLSPDFCRRIELLLESPLSEAWTYTALASLDVESTRHAAQQGVEPDVE
jgi:hypothetical protein